MVATAEPSSTFHAYRRDARKLRCVHAKNPARLHVALRDLAEQSDNVYRSLPLPEPSSDVRDFAKAVAASLDGPVLRYSNRKSLIKQAAALGIRRFDANLIIAAVQHRLSSESQSSQTTIVPPIRSTRAFWMVPLGAVVMMQIMICVAAYLVLH